MIKIINLNKYYNKNKSNEIHVINETNLDLPNNGLFTILGESGSGKTTLLNVIGGLDKATGTIYYDNEEFKNYSMGSIDKFRSKNIGYIFQNYNLLPNISVQDNLALALDLIGITNKEEVKKRIEYSLNAVGLFKFRKKLASQLSGGQMQRVAIARALVKKTKILIADEPTGNLDSSNSIEIMNILKKLSETTLVLLVTHDKQLAEFYSDKIIEVVDGKIEKIREATSTSVSLQNKNENKIYLKDMNKVEDGDDKIQSVVFTSGESPDIKLTLVEKNGTFYIKSNVKIKLLEESNLELIDDNYHDTTIESVKEEITYDNSWYDDTPNRNPFKRIWLELKTAFSTFKTKKKKQKFIRFILVIIGMIMGFMVIQYCNYAHLDKSNVIDDQSVVALTSRDGVTFDNVRAASKKLIEEGAITNVSEDVTRQSVEFYIDYNSFIDKSKSYYLYGMGIDEVYKKEVLAGRIPEYSNGLVHNYRQQEILLGKKIADKLVKDFNLDSYEDLLKNLKSRSFTVVGVSSVNTSCIYYDNISTFNDYSYSIVGYNYPCYYYEDVTSYEVVFGSYLSSTSNDNDVVLLINNTQELDDILNNGAVITFGYKSLVYKGTINATSYSDINITVGDLSYKVVGIVCDNTVEAGCSLIFKNENNIKGIYEYIKANPDPDARLYYYINTEISNHSSYAANVVYNSGFDVSSLKYDECVVSYYSEYSIGDTVTLENGSEYTVVAYYKDQRIASSDYITLNRQNLIIASPLGIRYHHIKDYCSYNNNIYIFWGDANTINSVLEANNFDMRVDNMNTIQIKGLKRDAIREKTVLAIVIGVMLSISIIYIYFTMRASMISDIYEIGVLRNIGASRSRISSKYFIQIVINTLFTTLIGYLFVVFGAGWILDKLYSLGDTNGIKIIGTPYPWLGLLVVFGVNIFFGILPIIMLLCKTPSEISSKYDI